MTGKYIGTLFTCFANPTIGQFTNPGYLNWSSMSLSVSNMSVAVTRPNIETDGDTGPARVVRWDGMSQGMQLDVAGKLWSQIIPQSSLTPFVKAAQMNGMCRVPTSAERLAKSIYNAAGTELRRVWNLRAYRQFLRSNESELTKEKIADWSQMDEGIDEAASASGIFRASGIRQRSDY